MGLVRNLWHLLAGLVPPLMALFLPLPFTLTVMGALTALFLGGEALRFLVPGLNRWLMASFSFVVKEKEAAAVTGSTYFVASGFLTLFIFPTAVAIPALLFAAVADPAAAAVGQRWGRRRAFSKTLEGSLAFLLVATAVALLAWGRLGLGLLPALLGAVVATLAELLPHGIDDNLAVPLASGLAMALASWL
ncbi:MAG: hypothetical protein HY687_00255 [Chloroflexi bacterium]|nr:hypothetical protein [Chloroflexota bacterium]